MHLYSYKIIVQSQLNLEVGITHDNRYCLIPVTHENGKPPDYRNHQWDGKGRQLEIDSLDFPTLAKTGLHSEKELNQTKTITGKSISEITARSITGFIKSYAPKTERVILCGGGAKNKYIVKRIKEELGDAYIINSTSLGYDSDYLEALLWAYLGYCFLSKREVDTRQFTGAKSTFIPGRLCLS